MVGHLHAYLADDEVENVVQSQHTQLARLIHSQMQAHYVELPEEYEAQVTKGFVELLPQAFTGERRPFREAAPEKRDTGRYIFGGFSKSIYSETKFQVEPERRLAVILEDDTEVKKWFRPETRDVRIFYSGDAEYRPDFIVETATARFLVEVKRTSDLETADVLAKAKAARQWCRHATAHAEQHGGKPWSYVLIPDEAVASNKSFAGLARAFAIGDEG
jgi:type III restriction enzyme